jgi:hypothetical protein
MFTSKVGDFCAIPLTFTEIFSHLFDYFTPIWSLLKRAGNPCQSDQLESIIATAASRCMAKRSVFRKNRTDASSKQAA